MTLFRVSFALIKGYHKIKKVKPAISRSKVGFPYTIKKKYHQFSKVHKTFKNLRVFIEYRQLVKNLGIV